MRKASENYIARDKDLEFDPTKQIKVVRKLDKMRAINNSPVFENSDDPDSEEFVSQNDKEKKYISIDDIADPDSDFLKKQEEDLDEERDNEEIEISEEGELEEVRSGIKDYLYRREGSQFSNLESFHVDHDKKEMLAVGSNRENNITDSSAEDNTREDLEPTSVNEDRIKKNNASKYELGLSSNNKRDNLKTWNDSKRQRSKRAEIREFLDRPIESSEEIRKEEELEKIVKKNKNFLERFLDRLN